MKNVLAFIGAIALLCIVTSAKDVIGRSNSSMPESYFITQIPLRQKKIVVVNTQATANKYVKNGWVLQDVDITSCMNNRMSTAFVKTIYTLIKY